MCVLLFFTLLNIAPHCFLLQLQSAGALLASLRLPSFPLQLATGCASFVQNARRPPPQFSTKQALNKPSHFAEPLAQRRVLPFSLVLFFFFFFSRSSGASLQMPSLRGSERERNKKALLQKQLDTGTFPAKCLFKRLFSLPDLTKPFLPFLFFCLFPLRRRSLFAV